MLGGYGGRKRREEESFSKGALGEVDGCDGREEVFEDGDEDRDGGKLGCAAVGDAEGGGELGLRW